MASKPINIFYGLSQGGRALAAALSHDNGGRLRGHGITHLGGFDRPISEIRIHDTSEANGSFTTIAALRGAPSLASPTYVGDLLAAQSFTSPGRPSWRGKPPALLLHHLDQGGQMLAVSSDKIFADTGPWPNAAELDEDLPVRRAWVEQYLAEHYPTLRGATPFPEERPSVRRLEGQPLITLRLDLEHAVGADSLRRELLAARAHRVGDGIYATPAIPPETRPVDPLVTLWAVLWTFSMLARYEPVRWSGSLDLDSSPDAVAIGELLNDALDFIPWFLLDTLDKLPD